MDQLKLLKKRIEVLVQNDSALSEYVDDHRMRKKAGEPGNCCLIAYFLALDLPDATLVHGAVDNGSCIMSHGWVDIEGVVVDLTLDPFMICPLDEYPFQVIHAVRFPHEQLVKRMLEHRHYGPWDAEIERFAPQPV